MTTPRDWSRYLKREGSVEVTTSLKFQLHQRGRSFLVSFKARDKIHIFMMLQATMKGEKSTWGERKQLCKAALLAKPSCEHAAWMWFLPFTSPRSWGFAFSTFFFFLKEFIKCFEPSVSFHSNTNNSQTSYPRSKQQQICFPLIPRSSFSLYWKNK